jgi:murein DD-endopeptidase MepM/ murein hydrolase activator NlpD
MYAANGNGNGVVSDINGQNALWEVTKPIQDSSAEVSSWFLRSTGEIHGGIDIAGIPNGTSIYNMYSGVVEYSGWANGYGNMVSIRLTEGPYQGLNMRYAHMNAPSALTVNSAVTAGKIIGGVGNSGTRETHLHIDTGLGTFTPRTERINTDALFRKLYP